MSKRSRDDTRNDNPEPVKAGSATSTSSSAKRTRKRRITSSPLQEFRKQQIKVRKQLQAERKRIDKQLRIIEKDIGTFKRFKATGQAKPEDRIYDLD